MTERDWKLTRRQSIGVVGAAGAAYALGRGPLGLLGSPTEAASAATCVVTPAKTEGPYFVDELLKRADITSNSDGSNTRPGVPLTLTINVVRTDDGCSVGEGAVVDIWHCDGDGNYSDESASSQDNTIGQDFLRGYQITDSNGQVTFETIYPGWYTGRTVHVHFKVRTFEGTSTTYEFTSQFFFDQSINNTVEVTDDYEGIGTTTNSNDTIYGDDTEVLVPLSGSVADGYTGEITVGLSGLPTTSDDPNPDDPVTDEVEAKVVAAKAERSNEGRRKVVARIRADERVSVRLRLVRDGQTLARGSGRVGKGTHGIALRVPAGVERGAARLSIVLEDAAGNVKSSKRKVSVPG